MALRDVYGVLSYIAILDECVISVQCLMEHGVRPFQIIYGGEIISILEGQFYQLSYKSKESGLCEIHGILNFVGFA